MDATCAIQNSIHVFSLVHINMCPGFWVHIIQSRRFFAFIQTYDEFSGNIVANSIVYALKISEKLMIVEI